MPRGQKSKLRAREKRRQARADTQLLESAQAEKAEGPSSAGRSENVPAAGTPSAPKGCQGTPSTAVAVASGDTKSQDVERQKSSRSIEDMHKDPLNKKVVLMVQFLLEKYQNKEPITKADMLKFVIKSYKRQFNEILKRASEHMLLAFGVDLREVDPIRHCYTLFSKLQLTFDGRMDEEEENMPRTSLLMIVLGVIFMKGNCAQEEDIWEVLNVMGVYADKNHLIYGDPKKTITEELVQLKYLVYRQVANSDPPRYEFLWGPQAHIEISKMRVLEFLARIHNTVPSAFPSWYEEALKDEEERARARAAARAAIIKHRSRATAGNQAQAK